MWAELGSCGACHTAPDDAPYAGGHAIVTDRGTFFGPNITPDPAHGIGTWDFADFARAMTEGRAPDGHTYWPAFPYPAYARLRPQELADLWAFLQTVPPSARPDQAHEVGMPRWPAAGFWRRRYFEPGAYADDPSQSAEWNRGAYLGLGIGHCGECHSPRNRLGAIRTEQALAGSPGPPESAPDITPGPRGLSAWSHSDLAGFFVDGITPSGDVVGGEMGRIVEHGTAQLSPTDRAALATWLLSVPPSTGEAPPPDAAPEPQDEEKEDWE